MSAMAIYRQLMGLIGTAVIELQLMTVFAGARV